jgi:hypothetical protein
MPSEALQLGGAAVSIGVDLDQLDQGLNTARLRLEQFDKATASRTGMNKMEQATKGAQDALRLLANQLVAVQRSSDLAGSSVGATGGAIAVALERVATLDRELAKAEMEVVGARQKSAVAANDNAKAVEDSSERSGKSLLELGIHVVGLVGKFELIGAVAMAASPKIKAFIGTIADGAGGYFTKAGEAVTGFGTKVQAVAPVVVKTGESLAAMGPFAVTAGKAVSSLAPAFSLTGKAVAGFVPAVTTAAHEIEKLKAIGDAVEIGHLAMQFNAAGAAAYAMSPAVRQVANEKIIGGVKALGGTVYTLGTAFGVVGTVVTSALKGLAGFAAAYGLPIAAVTALVMGLKSAWDQAGEQLEKFKKANADAFAAHVGVEFFTRNVKAADEFGLKLEDISASLKRFNESTESALGGSEFGNRLKELTKAGNFKGNAGVGEFNNAKTAEEKWAAVTTLLSTAVEKGERLAAIDLAKRFMSPEMLARFKENGQILKEMEEKAKEIKPVSFVDQKQAADAQALNTRLDEAYEKIHKFFTVTVDLSAIGMGMKDAWTNFVEVIAVGAGLVDKLITALDFDSVRRGIYETAEGLSVVFQTARNIGADLISWFTQVGNEIAGNFFEAFNNAANVVKGWVGVVSDYMKPLFDWITTSIANITSGWGSVGTGISGATQYLQDFIKWLDDIVAKIPLISKIVNGIGALKDYITSKLPAGPSTGSDIANSPRGGDSRTLPLPGVTDEQKRTAALNTSNAALDRSKNVTTAARDAWDKATESIRKHSISLLADALSVGKSVGEHEQLKAEFQLLEAAKNSDKRITDEMIVSYTKFRQTMSATDAVTAAGIPLEAKKRAEFIKTTEALRERATVAEKAKVAGDIEFGQKTALLTQSDIAIAQQLKGIYGNDIPAALNSSEAAAIRFNGTMSSVAGTVSGELSNALTSIWTGTAKASDAFKNMGIAIVTALQKMIVELYVVTPLFRALQQAMSGLSTPTGASSTGAPGFATPEQRAANGAVFSHGIHGFSNQVVTRPTHFAFARGAGLMGEAGPEAIMPLKRGADGKLGVAGGAGAGGGTVVNVINNAEGTKTEQKQRKDGDTSVVDIVISTVKKGFADGSFDSTLRSRHGLDVKPVLR